MKLWHYLKEKIMIHPEQLICENDAELSFEEAVIWAELFAPKLAGVKCCAILCQSEMAAALALLACLAANIPAVPLSLRYGAIHCQKILEAIDPDAIIMDEDGELEITRISDSHYVVPEESPALIMCTSGTTGKPKGVMLSGRNIMTNVTDIASYFAIGKGDTILISRPIYHCAVLTGEFLAALVKGTNIRFYSGVFNPPELLKLIAKYGITAFCGTPTLLSMMARFQKQTAPDSLKHICISGECMSRDIGLRIAAAFPTCEIYHVYGLTEACPRVSYLPPALFQTYPEYVGIPLRSTAVKIVNAQGETCASDQEGVLWVKGDNIMLGYYRDPAKTAQIFQDGWLCTGDIAEMNDKGLIKIKGRSDDMIIKAGMNIYPAEIEGAVKKDPRVHEVLVYSFENSHGKQIGMKVVGDFVSPEQVKQMCGERLPGFQIPNHIELVSELPKNGGGKIIRKR